MIPTVISWIPPSRSTASRTVVIPETYSPAILSPIATGMPRKAIAETAKPSALVGHRRRREADPDRHPAEEPRPLAHRVERLQRAPVEQPEVAGVLGQVDLGEAREEAVEPAGRRELHPRLPGALGADRVDDVRAVLPVLDHGQDQLRRVLQVGVDHHDHGAPGMVQAGRDRRLVAEVARERDDT